MDLITAQSLILPICIMMAGIILLVKGGDWTINASVFIAKRFGLSPLIVGFTILAFGTSLPELIVSVLAVIRGSGGIAMGNVIGSNIANILLVLGITSIMVTLTATISKALIKDLIMMLICSVLLLALMMHGEISRVAGIGMILLLATYVFVQYKMASRGERPVEDISEEELGEYSSPTMPYMFLIMGLIGIAGGAELLVRGAKDSALIIGVPEAVIALSIIAFGTSLPELTTSIIAGRKGQPDMIIGNIVGSNVFNILMILGATAIFKPISENTYAPQLLSFDIWFMIAISIIFALILMTYKKINKPLGIVFATTYVAYNIYIYAIYFGT